MPPVPPGYKSVKSNLLDNLENDNFSSSWDDLEKIVGEVEWLVPGWIPLGMLTGLIAQPKAGKSGFAVGALAKPTTTGCDWFTGDPGPEPGFVMYCDTENSGSINTSRARQWGIPLKRIRTAFREDPCMAVNLESDEHLVQMAKTIDHYKIKLVVIDSLRGGHEGNENDSRMVGPLKKLAQLAELSRAAVVIIHHTKKMQIGEDMTINAARGSNSFLAAVRCQIAIDIPDPRPNPREAWRRCQVLGENLGTAPPPIGFRYGETGLEIGQAPVRQDTQADKAADWLRSEMEQGKWHSATELTENAHQAGISSATLQRARELLGVKKPGRVRKVGDEWQWRLGD